MKWSVDGRLRAAARLAFVGGTVGISAFAQDAYAQSAATETSGDKAVQLQGVQVTGSLLRRVDTESANPVTTVSRKAIESSGVTTVGQLLQQLPSLSGDALTPQVNNGGGGDGASTISLRGLGSQRTLILLDGKRIVTSDVNTLPVNMIERVEVLNEGAGTVYGSDAIGGVVNFITRKNFTGFEATSSYGATTEHDDARKFSTSLTTGVSGDKGRAVFGLSYDNQGEIKASRRDVGSIVTNYIYNQLSPLLGLSSRVPGGRFYTTARGNYPRSATDARACNSQLTRIAGTDGSTAADFRCRQASDVYNYQTENLLYTPNDHIQLFSLGQYNFNEDVRGYSNLLFNRTGGHNQLAPEAFDSSTLSDPNGNLLSPVISQYSQYNPLGADVTKFTFRALETGDRVTHANNNIFQGTLGVKATIFDRFEWDTSGTYGREDDTSVATGYLNVAQLSQQLGPSRNGVCYTDNTYTTAINGCTPVNILGTYGNTYRNLSKPVVSTASTDVIIGNSNISGELFSLPAGALSGAIGLEVRRYRLDSEPDSAAQAFLLSEANGAATSGAYDVREVYGEFLIPLLKDLPGVHSLNIDVGTRFSEYSNFGSTTNSKFAAEYRPIKDLLLRATYSDIFRAPTIGDLYAGRATTAPSYVDICKGYTPGTTSQVYPNLATACAGVPAGYAQPDSQGSTTVGGNPNLRPETGYTTDFGLVYSPNWYRPLTVTFDYYNYSIKNTIEALGLQTYLSACGASGDPRFCGDGTTNPNNPIIRDSSGAVVGGLEVSQNIGGLTTRGFDFGVQLNYPKTRFGSFGFDVTGTYLQKYKQTVTGSDGSAVLSYSLAGQNAASFVGGGYPRLKMVSSLNWAYGPIDVVLRNRFIATETDNGGQDGLGNNYGLDATQTGYIGNADTYRENYGISGVGRCNEGGKSYTTTGGEFSYACKRDQGYVDYQDIQITYKARPLHTDFTVGMNDIFAQGAPISYTYGPAFNYDASNYDVTGRFVYGRVKFYLK